MSKYFRIFTNSDFSVIKLKSNIKCYAFEFVLRASTMACEIIVLFRGNRYSLSKISALSAILSKRAPYICSTQFVNFSNTKPTPQGDLSFQLEKQTACSTRTCIRIGNSCPSPLFNAVFFASVELIKH